MMQRRDFGLLGLSAIAVAALDRTSFGQSTGNKKHMPDETMKSCAEACSDCQRECDLCSTHCAHLLSEGKKEHLTTLRTCQDCADVCATAAQIVSRGGPFAVLICEPCAEACARCAEECEKFPDDPHMKRCAEECRKCENACKEMVQHHKKQRASA